MNRIKNKSTLTKILLILVVIIAIPLTVLLVQQVQVYLSRAAGTAKVYFIPATTTMPPDKTVSVMVDSLTSKVGFVNVDLSFDITKVRLSGEVIPTAPFTQIIEQTTMAQANTTGKIKIVIAVKPADAAAAPSGNFEVAKLPFHAISTQANGVTTVTNNTATSQIVDMNAEALTITSEALTFNLNPATTAPAGTVNMKIQNYPASVIRNATFSAELGMNTNNFDIVGTDLVVNFDATRLTLNSATTPVFAQTNNKVINNTTGVFSASLLINTSDQPVKGSNVIPVIFNFTAKNTGVANITISPTSVIAGTGPSGQNLTIAATNGSVTILAPTATPTVAPTATPTVAPTASPTIRPSGTPTTAPTQAPTAAPTAVPTVAPTPTPTATPIVYVNEDINQDTIVDTADYIILFTFYGQQNPTNSRADINRDGIVNVKDYALLYQKFSF